MIRRGDVHDVDLGRPVGHEPVFKRPAVVVTADAVHNGPGGLVAVVPVGSASYGLRSHVALEPGTTGLSHLSYARCDQLRVIAVARLVGYRGSVPPDGMRAIERAIRFVLDL